MKIVAAPRTGQRPIPRQPFTTLGTLLGVAFMCCAVTLVRHGASAAELRDDYRAALARTEQLRPPRGEIVDRNGRAIAESVVRYEAWAESKLIPLPLVPQLAGMLATTTGVEESALHERLAKRAWRQLLFTDLSIEQYQVIRRWKASGWTRQAHALALDPECGRLIKAQYGGSKARWFEALSHAVGNIVVQPVTHRHYPYGSLAGQTLGFVTEQPDRITPFGGIELWADQWLSGDAVEVPVRAVTRGDAAGAPSGKQASNVQVTLDADAQAFVENALARGLQRTRATSGVAVVMDSQTGDILALASVPVFDPELYRAYRQPVKQNGLEFGSADGSAAEPPMPPLSCGTHEVAAALAPVAPGMSVLLPEARAVLGEAPQVLVNDWPPSGSTLDQWTSPTPLAMIPGIADEHRRNGALTWAVEPGSIFKPFALLAALEHHRITLEERVSIPAGRLRIRGATIGDHHGMGESVSWTPSEIMIHSSNRGMTRIALKTRQDAFVETFAKLHLGEKCLGLPGEPAGSYFPTREWRESELATAAFGQGLITMTPVQLTAAMNALATGSYIRPRLIRAVQEPDGHWREFPNAPAEATLDPGAVAAIQEMLAGVVLEGTGTRAAVEGFAVAGKTGTAYKVKDGKYASGLYISSFLGYGPAAAPKYTVLVMYDEPQIDKFGGLAAAPVFGEVLSWLLRRDEWQGLQETVQGREVAQISVGARAF